MTDQLLPFAQVVRVEAYDPPRRLWHVPNSPPNQCPLCGQKTEHTRVTFSGHDFHPQCFICSLCRQPFPNASGVIQRDDLILHKQCFLDCFADRCATCTKVIDPTEVIQAMGKYYHTDCFACKKCGAKGAAMTKFMPLYQFPYCQHCYEELQTYFPICLVCKKVIHPNTESETFNFRGRKYFAHSPDCFKCSNCSEILHDQEVNVFDNRLYCGKCFSEGFKKICATCNEPIFGQASRLENVFWHPAHFVCSVCHQPLKPNFCVFNAGILKCRACSADDQTKCAGCQKPVFDNGIQACNQIWHPQCLKCQFCEIVVFNKKFTNLRDRPCCEDCFKKLKSEGRIKNGQLINKAIEEDGKKKRH